MPFKTTLAAISIAVLVFLQAGEVRAQQSPNSAWKELYDAEFDPCTPDSLWEDLHNAENFEPCPTGDTACFRSVGALIASLCVATNPAACHQADDRDDDPQRQAEIAACQARNDTFIAQSYDRIVAELPSAEEVKRIDGLGFTDERKIIQQMEDLSVAAWPPQCGAFPEDRQLPENHRCFGLFYHERLELVSGITGMLFAVQEGL